MEDIQGIHANGPQQSLQACKATAAGWPVLQRNQPNFADEECCLTTLALPSQRAATGAVSSHLRILKSAVSSGSHVDFLLQLIQIGSFT